MYFYIHSCYNTSAVRRKKKDSSAKMKSIAVLTATRAEYGLLSPIIKELVAINKYDVRVVVTGTHLSEKFGNTVNEIEIDGIEIDERIPILTDGDKPSDISKTMANALTGFSDYFERKRPDALLVLGDRYETLAVCCAAMNERIPIIHLYGGEKTEGAIDEAIRHSITKLSYLHLTSTDEYKKRVIQLGESPNRVFCVGAIGIENALNKKLMSREELSSSIGFDLTDDFAVVTFHPVTLEGSSSKEQCEELFKALDNNKLRYIITKANADADGQIINEMIDEYGKSRNNVFVINSLGMVRYLSALNEAVMVIGNSSSGLVEAPSFHIPTVNIGDRQKGRLRADSIIDCEPTFDSIDRAIKLAESDGFIKKCQNVSNPYGDGETSKKVVSAINNMFDEGIELKKKFYDVM